MPRTASKSSRRLAREPLLDVHDIQGNILAGFNKDHQKLIAVKFRDLPAARRWIRRLTPDIDSTAEVFQFNALFRMRRARLGGRDPEGLVATWANVAFSYPGLAALTSKAEADGIPSGVHEPFQEGLAARAALLGDLAELGQDPTAGWVIGGVGRVPDALLIVASDDPAQLEAMSSRLAPGQLDGTGAPEVMWVEDGRTRADLPGHEHFGFKDGVSQPGVRGLVSRRPNILLTPRLLAPAPPGQVDFSAPGQPLVWPGQFVFGYASTNREDGSPVPPFSLRPAWIKNGSLLVFRRLRQDVAGFTAFVRGAAKTLAATPEFAGITPSRLGAMLVGRWASGAPIARAPLQDDPSLARDRLSDNDFLFLADTPPPDFRDGVPAPRAPFPPAREDFLGVVCPRAAHIRKVNPRDHDSNFGDPFDTLTRRMLRRGIPYGPPQSDPSVDDGIDRGLHFLCYVTNIEDQFELLQTDWANNTLNPAAGGHDVLIGQTADQTRTVSLVSAAGVAHTVTAPRHWVTPTGGGYFFAPSIRALRDVLGRDR